MTHTLDIGTDLDDLLASIGDLTAGSDDTADAVIVVPVPEDDSLVHPKVIRGAWYR